jgi:hypothetical protein
VFATRYRQSRRGSNIRAQDPRPTRPGLIIDLRPLNMYCKDHKLTYETLKHLKNLTRGGDLMVSFDLADGYYTLGIQEEDIYFFMVNYRGTVYRLAGLPIGWKCSCYYFCRLTEVFMRQLRESLPNPTGHNPRLATNQQPTRPTPSRRYLRNSRWRGARLLPYIDDFLLFAESRDAALQLRDRVACLLDRLGLGRNPQKGHMEPTQICEHVDTDRHHNLYVPSPCFEATCNRYPLPDLPTALCTLRTVATTAAARSARQKSTIHVPRHSSSPLLPPRTPRHPRYAHMMGRPGATHLPVKTRPPMVDASPLRQQRPLHFLPHRLPALRQLKLRLGSSVKRAAGSTGLWSAIDQQQHITSKELKATRLAVLSFLPLRPQSPHARRQPSSGGCPQSPYVPVPGYDGRASKTLGTHRHQQHQHPRALYSLRGQRLGRLTEPRNRHGRLAAQPPHLHLLRPPVGPPLLQQVCHAWQLVASPLQLPPPRPHLRSRGLPPSSRQLLDSGDQLVQPTLDTTPRPRP